MIGVPDLEPRASALLPGERRIGPRNACNVDGRRRPCDRTRVQTVIGGLLRARVASSGDRRGDGRRGRRRVAVRRWRTARWRCAPVSHRGIRHRFHVAAASCESDSECESEKSVRMRSIGREAHALSVGRACIECLYVPRTVIWTRYTVAGATPCPHASRSSSSSSRDAECDGWNHTHVSQAQRR
jgi:hypothetical protein